MMKFNIGDEIICIDDETSSLIKGNTYTILEITEITRSKYITVKEIPNSLFWTHRFKKINQQLLPDELFEL